MDRLVHGKADMADWNDICEMLNVTVALAEMGVGKEFVPEIQKAMIAHAMCGRRFKKHDKFGYSGTELQDVNGAIEIHEAQLEVATIIQMEQALDIVNEANRKQNYFVSVNQEGKYGGEQEASVPPVGSACA
jgi:hypothetical protein